MNNTILLIGRLVAKPILEETEQKYAKITIAVNRSYKNIEGIYETDFIDIILYNMIAKSASEYCQKGDLIGIKGRLETKYYENENNEKKKELIVIADKLTFLSSKRKEDEE